MSAPEVLIESGLQNTDNSCVYCFRCEDLSNQLRHQRVARHKRKIGTGAYLMKLRKY